MSQRWVRHGECSQWGHDGVSLGPHGEGQPEAWLLLRTTLGPPVTAL